MVFKRRKGVAIIENNKGILVVAGKNKKFSLPGGGAEKFESRKKATIRELYEETNLKTKKINYLFRYIGNSWYNHKNKRVINYIKVFLVEPEGNPEPKNEISYLSFWKAESNLDLTDSTKRIIEKYIKSKQI